MGEDYALKREFQIMTLPTMIRKVTKQITDPEQHLERFLPKRFILIIIIGIQWRILQWGWRIRILGVSYAPLKVAHTFNGGGVYIQWGWRMHPMGVAYTLLSKGDGVYF